MLKDALYRGLDPVYALLARIGIHPCLDLLGDPRTGILPLLLLVMAVGILGLAQPDRLGHPAVVCVPRELIALRERGAVRAARLEGLVRRVVGSFFVETIPVSVVPVLTGAVGHKEEVEGRRG
jgi:hypothetical protein